MEVVLVMGRGMLWKSEEGEGGWSAAGIKPDAWTGAELAFQGGCRMETLFTGRWTERARTLASRIANNPAF